MTKRSHQIQPVPAATGQVLTASNAEQQPSQGLSASLTLLAMSLGYGVVQLDVTIVNTALDRIGTSLGGGVSELQWVVNAYTIAFAAFILTAGALGDRIGAKRVFMAGFAIFTSASLACALASNSAVLIAARAVQGLGAAVLVPNSLALLNHAYPDQRGARTRGRNLGGRRQPRAHGGTVGRWRIDRADRLAIDLSGQSADRHCRALVELALRHGDHAQSTARGRFARPGSGDRSTWWSCWHHHRGRCARLQQRLRDRRLCGLGAARHCCSLRRKRARRIRCCRYRCLRIACSH